MSARATTLTYQPGDPSRRAIGWALVVILHLFAGYALVSGTARSGLELIKKPLEAVVIQEVIIPPPPPPPPPPKEIRPPEQKVLKTEAPPPFVPPPEVAAPVSAAPVIESAPTPPVTAPVIAPPVPAAPPAPSRAEIGVVCPTQIKPEMPRKAIQEGTEGVVKAQAMIRDGAVREVTILSGPRVFHAAVRNAMLQYKCVAGAGDVSATQEFVFRNE